jgi:hypothetical protein
MVHLVFLQVESYVYAENGGRMQAQFPKNNFIYLPVHTHTIRFTPKTSAPLERADIFRLETTWTF